MTRRLADWHADELTATAKRPCAARAFREIAMVRFVLAMLIPPVEQTWGWFWFDKCLLFLLLFRRNKVTVGLLTLATHQSRTRFHIQQIMMSVRDQFGRFIPKNRSIEESFVWTSLGSARFALFSRNLSPSGYFTPKTEARRLFVALLILF